MQSVYPANRESADNTLPAPQQVFATLEQSDRKRTDSSRQRRVFLGQRTLATLVQGIGSQLPSKDACLLGAVNEDVFY